MRILKRLLDFIASRMLLITVVCALLVISLAFIVIPMIKSAKDKKKGVAKA